MKKISDATLRKMTDTVIHAALTLAKAAEDAMEGGLVPADSELGMAISDYADARDTFDDAATAQQVSMLEETEEFLLSQAN